MPVFPFSKVITITPQTVDNFGDRTNGTPIDVSGCVTYEVPGLETVGGQDTVVVDITVLAPPGTVISPTDRVTIDGALCEVSSQPIAWRSPLTNTQPGIQFTARKVTG